MALALHPGRTIAAGILCAIAATVGVWSGPLASATSALHSSGASASHVAFHSSSQEGHTVR
jgi:hypothetical protein